MAAPRPDLEPPTHPLERLPEEWAECVRAWGEPAYRGKQIFQWIHARGVVDPAAMSDLPKRLREKLAAEGLGLPLEVARLLPASDGTRKMLVRMADGTQVETVLLPQLVERGAGAARPNDASGAGAARPNDASGAGAARPDDARGAGAARPNDARGACAPRPEDDEDDREDDLKAGLEPGDVVTQCISSQVGCAMGCVFCASGIAGLQRHMTAAEIVSQVLLGRAHLHGSERVRNVVLMGMGEPLHNYENVARALVLLTHPDGIALSRRRVTLSTSGLVPAIDRLGRDFAGQIALAVSLHAVTDEKRSSIMPVNRKHGLTELIDCLRRYPMPKRRRITIEYTLIRGVNDGVEDADRMASLLRGVPVKVNLIPMNPVPDTPLAAPDLAAVRVFQERLFARGLSVFVRKQRGEDIDAACGQLALHGAEAKRKRTLPTVRQA